MIRLEEVSKVYPSGFWRRRVPVLSGISFEVAPGEIVGFLGPNGAGKTTTIKIVTGLAFPTAGTVTLFGEAAGGNPRVRRRIGFMPEHPYYYEYLTGREFLALCGHLCGMERARLRKRSGELLEQVGLAAAGDTAIRKYSKGMMQRLGLVQAILHEPELVILDEPMSGLDPMGRMEVRHLIRDLRRGGMTVFFSSHIISDVEALCDRVVMIHRGRKVAEGSLEGLVGEGGVRSVEMTFAPPHGRESFPGPGFPEGSWAVQGNLLLLRAPDHGTADRWIGTLTGRGFSLRSCLPVKRSLEEIYVERVGGEPARGGGAPSAPPPGAG